MNNVNLVKMKVEGSSKSHSRADIISRDVESVIDEPEARGGTNLGLTPTETLLAPVVFCKRAKNPTPVLLLAVVVLAHAWRPIPTLLAPLVTDDIAA